MFDEVALMNDINAACAAAHQFSASSVASQPVGDVDERLLKLQSLKAKELIEEADFERRKKEIMDQL